MRPHVTAVHAAHHSPRPVATVFAATGNFRRRSPLERDPFPTNRENCALAPTPQTRRRDRQGWLHFARQSRVSYASGYAYRYRQWQRNFRRSGTLATFVGNENWTPTGADRE